MTERDRKRSILVVGGPNTGKTLFGAQLLGRLQAGRGRVRLRRAPESIEPLKRALEQLNQGLLADHTAFETYEELVLPVEVSREHPVDLVWPDYGGEQVRDMIEGRRVGDHWFQRIRDSTGWLLLIRPSLINPQDDIFSRPIHKVVEPSKEVSAANKWSDQARYTELLQLLLFVRGLGSLKRITGLRLAVVLSCWDEMNDDATPESVLRERMPLFFEFLQAVWDAQDIEIFGLSSLGRALENGVPDRGYQDHGPEAFGYVTSAADKEEKDLLLPVEWILK